MEDAAIGPALASQRFDHFVEGIATVNHDGPVSFSRESAIMRRNTSVCCSRGAMSR